MSVEGTFCLVELGPRANAALVGKPNQADVVDLAKLSRSERLPTYRFKTLRLVDVP